MHPQSASISGADMPSDLGPVSMARLAQRLKTDPFELIRLRVVSGADLTHLSMGTMEAERLRAFAGFDELCERVALSSPVPLSGHQWVPGLLAILLEENRCGENTVRMDNLWRGLEQEDADIVKNIIRVLVEEGYLSTYTAPQGIQLSIHPGRRQAIHALVTGETIPDSLAYLWKA